MYAYVTAIPIWHIHVTKVDDRKTAWQDDHQEKERRETEKQWKIDRWWSGDSSIGHAPKLNSHEFSYVYRELIALAWGKCHSIKCELISVSPLKYYAYICATCNNDISMAYEYLGWPKNSSIMDESNSESVQEKCSFLELFECKFCGWTNPENSIFE